MKKRRRLFLRRIKEYFIFLKKFDGENEYIYIEVNEENSVQKNGRMVSYYYLYLMFYYYSRFFILYFNKYK